ncbi:gamma-glutamylcyclotransferase family protein [Massiliimalia massiliensis]|uniref:gamma-glutamylcyclotransferase family protein n=1 Tax=Massiliimalia massiliensis TaxID=1852384 RepID=UPI000985E94A|nr:gamma-glutamylcyclotransferase family protein [Massiliimalia massiliensis]
MSKRLYVAYGSNLNIRQMKYRCPGAKLYGTGVIDNYELQFKGQPHSAFATIAPKEGSSVPVAVWEIKSQDERSLDRYEGYPAHYFKQNVPVQLDSEEVNAMVYIMNLKMGFGLPTPYYYQTVLEGYHNCELDTDILDNAVKDSTQKYYRECSNRFGQQTLFNISDSDDDPEYENEDFDDEEEELANEEPEMDESDPFYFSEGMHW